MLLQVKEARARLQQLYVDQPDRQANFIVDFDATPDIGDKVWRDPKGPYDAVTCMFALHYFFHSEATARNAVAMAADNLKPGGYFFGVLPDGKNVQETIGPSMEVRRAQGA